jgi:hypothetical protein
LGERSRGLCLFRPVQSIPTFKIEGVEVSRAILGCDCFVSWLYQGGSSSFQHADGSLNVSRVLDVMRTCVGYGVTGVDVSPPLVDAFKKLQDVADHTIVGLGAIQEWFCRSFTIDGVPLENYSEEIKATVSSKLPPQYMEGLVHSKRPETDFAKAFFVPNRSAESLTKAQIYSIKIEPRYFEEKLEFYRRLGLELVQFGGGVADWLASIGRMDLLAYLSELIRKRGFRPLLVCHWASIVLPLAEKELDVAGYVIPINRLWSLLSLSEALNVTRNVKKPLIAMKPLARGVLANDLDGAFTFLFRKAKVEAVMVGVSSRTEARQTFSAIAKMLRE